MVEWSKAWLLYVTSHAQWGIIYIYFIGVWTNTYGERFENEGKNGTFFGKSSAYFSK